LKRLAAHLAVGDDCRTDALLQSHGLVDGAVFDCFELRGRNCSVGEMPLSLEDISRPKQATDDVGVSCNHGCIAVARSPNNDSARVCTEGAGRYSAGA
jgi:hypothetical protein